MPGGNPLVKPMPAPVPIAPAPKATALVEPPPPPAVPPAIQPAPQPAPQAASKPAPQPPAAAPSQATAASPPTPTPPAAIPPAAPPPAAEPPSPPHVGAPLAILQFASQSAEISGEARAELERVAKNVAAIRTIELRAHAGGADPNDARKVALARALTVRSCLIDLGVKSRIEVGAFAAENRGAASDRVEILVPNS